MTRSLPHGSGREWRVLGRRTVAGPPDAPLEYRTIYTATNEPSEEAEAIARWKLEVGAPAHRPDNCHKCGREMPLTGDQLCRSCYEDEERRSRCIVCGERKVWLDEACCSDACDQIYAGWPEP